MKNNITKAEKKERSAIIRARRYRRFAKMGFSDEQIKELEKNENVRTIMCLPYSSYSVENGTKLISVGKKKDKKEVPDILRGCAAVIYTMKQHNIDVLSSGSNYVYITTTVDKLDEITDLMKQMGRIYVHKWHPAKDDDNKNKKPTNNTKEAKKNAKNARKVKNKSFSYMRPFYAAARNGSVSKRIKMHNPKLAKEIEEWLKNRKTTNTKRKNRHTNSHTNGHYIKHEKRNMTLLEIKAIRRANKVGRAIIRKEEKKALEAKRMAKNDKKLKASIKKKEAKKEQSLKFAA